MIDLFALWRARDAAADLIQPTSFKAEDILPANGYKHTHVVPGKLLQIPLESHLSIRRVPKDLDRLHRPCYR